MRARYPETISSEHTPFRAWAIFPALLGTRPIGAVSFSFATERVLSENERELLAAAAAHASLAFDRCRLLEAESRARAETALQRARLDETLHAGEERLQATLNAARVGTWTVELKTMKLVRDASYCALLGLEGRIADHDFSDVHPDDRSSAEAAFQRTLRDGVPYEPEMRLRRDDGSFVWMRAHGRLLNGSDGRPAVLTGLIVDIDASKSACLRANQERGAAIERALAADRRRDEFLAMLGHELRNPLAPIVTALALMERRSPTQQQHERAVIRRQVDHLTRLVDDLLDVSRITRGKIQLTRQVIEIRSVLSRAVEMVSPLLEKRRHRLVFDVAAEGLPVDADGMRLSQVFQNLLNNAAKYSDSGAEIRLSASSRGDDILVEIRDHGIGIAPDLLPRLFQQFVQGERAIDRSEGGLGLGLTIVDSLLELHGGSISAHSEGLGHGSSFVVTLPRAPEAGPPTLVEAPPAPRVQAQPRRVLIVDDNVDAAQMLEELVRDLGHEPRVVYDALAALDLVDAFKPSIALLDLGLPVMDGFELARKLRASFDPAALRLIAVTGYGQDSDRLKAKEAGFDHHLVKPIDVSVLIPLIDSD
jgi:two-component system CheB/CheR fusion protein